MAQGFTFRKWNLHNTYAYKYYDVVLTRFSGSDSSLELDDFCSDGEVCSGTVHMVAAGSGTSGCSATSVSIVPCAAWDVADWEGSFWKLWNNNLKPQSEQFCDIFKVFGLSRNQKIQMQSAKSRMLRRFVYAIKACHCSMICVEKTMLHSDITIEVNKIISQMSDFQLPSQDNFTKIFLLSTSMDI